ncbi:MAG: EAL domain-containing protein [Halofilum sp. (in: g-proteobacteria)]
MINPDPCDPSAPTLDPAAQVVGHVCPAGRIRDFGERWQWLAHVGHVRDLVEPDHQTRIDQTLATAVEEGQAEVEAVFRGGATPFLWRFVRADDTRVCVLAAPIATDPMTGLATALTFDATGELHARRDLAINRTELLKKIARGDDLVVILYELIGAIEQYRGRVTAAILGLRGGLLHVQAAPGLSNDCIEAMHERAPSELGGAIRAAVTGDPATAGDGGATSDLAAAMRSAGYGDVVAFPVRDLPGAVLGVLTVFVTEPADAEGPFAEILDEMAQIASIAFEQHDLTRQLLRQAHYDPLTQLPNRTLLDDRLDQLILEAGRNESAVGVMMIDLDDFKLVNDTLGHAAGDNLLQQVATRLETCLRASDTVARFGGDEFVITTPLDDPALATDIAQRVLAALQAPFSIRGRSVDARPSMGISLFPQDSLSAEGLLQAADTAMYTAKMAGKNRYHYFSESMNAEVSRRLRIEGELRSALAQRELVLHYQPIMALADEAVVGSEALIRWHHPEQGLLLPGAFLPVAEQSELVNEIDQYVMAHAMDQVAQWQRSGHQLLMSLIVTSLNISARGLQEEGFAARVGRLLRDTGVDPRNIELEITESMIMRDFDSAVEQLHDLKEGAPGLRIAVDDFGTGHASFAYLRQLPVDTLKIDMSFIADLDKPRIAQSARAIVKTVVALGRNLGLTVVAEGVETPAQAEFLRSIGCHRAQGYLYAHPLDPASFEAFVG